MSKTNIDNLELSIYNAIKAARKAIVNVKDDSACNFDEVIIYIDAPRTQIISMEYKCEKVGKHLYSLDIDFEGQANKRTVMAETIVKNLKADGFNTGVKYVMD